MEWISGIKRDGNSELCVEVQDQQGARSQKYLEDVRGDLHRTGDIKKSMTVNLNDAKPASLKQYVADLELPHLDASCQTAYQFDTEAGRFIVPSQLIIMSMMGTTSDFRCALFKPWGLESFMIAFHDGEHVIYKLNPVRPTVRGGLSLGKCQSQLRWLTSFQSARMAWSTVYRSALEGRFDTRLPAAKLTMAVYCRQVENRFLVTKALLSTMEALEEPHAFMKGCIKEMSITDGRMAKMRDKSKFKKMVADHRIRHLVPSLSLTDTQWNCIEPILKRLLKPINPSIGVTYIFPIRLLMDTIFVKLGTPLQWNNELLSETRDSAYSLLSRLKKSCTWEIILEALQKQLEGSPSLSFADDNADVLVAAQY